MKTCNMNLFGDISVTFGFGAHIITDKNYPFIEAQFILTS